MRGTVLVVLSISALIFGGSGAAGATTSGSFERLWPGTTQCTGTWTFDGANVSVSGEARDLNPNDGQPAVCLFTIRYDSGALEFYHGLQGAFGPYVFQKGTNPRELKAQPCTREWTGMDECAGYHEPPIWAR